MKIFFIIWFLVFSAGTFAQNNKSIADGNNFYRQQEYNKAEDEYQKVLQASPHNIIAKFNLADALIRQDKTDKATTLLRELNAGGNEADLRSKAAYNHGVILSHQKKLEESIELYKESLRLNPNDQEARENLQKALLELKKKNPPKPKEEKKKKEEKQQKQHPKPKISPREAQQQLKLLEQKEKQVQQRIQKNSSKTGASQPKDW
jgi:Ca-activated chloride channel family protein